MGADLSQPAATLSELGITAGSSKVHCTGHCPVGGGMLDRQRSVSAAQPQHRSRIRRPPRATAQLTQPRVVSVVQRRRDPMPAALLRQAMHPKRVNNRVMVGRNLPSPCKGGKGGGKGKAVVSVVQRRRDPMPAVLLRQATRPKRATCRPRAREVEQAARLADVEK